MSALENWELGDETADEIDDTPPIPANIDEADWQLRRLGRLRRRMAENEALAAARVALARKWLARKWLAEENGKLERHAAFFEQSLAAFHAHLLEQDSKRKTISLPAGTLKARKHPDKVDLIHVEAFIPWAMEHRPDLVRIKPEPMKAEIKRLLSVGPSAGDYGLSLVDPTTGETAPGVVLVEGETMFTVDVDLRKAGDE